MDLRCFVTITVLFIGVLSTQCPDGTNSNIVRSVKYVKAGDTSAHTCLYDIKYDVTTGDFFYLGRINPAFYVSRTNNLANHVWINVFSDTPALFSMEYSPTYQKVYHAIHNSMFTLIRMNSTNGDYLDSYYVSGVSQGDYEYTCSLSNDELALYCNVDKSGDGKGIVRFDTNSQQISMAYYPSGYNYVHDILAIDSNQVFYHIRLSNSIHLIKATYSSSSNLLVEDIHKSMPGYTYYDDCAISRLDENEQTIWHSVINGNIVYFQHNLTDFSLIGSKFSSTSSQTRLLLGMDILDGIVWILYENTVILINSTTQNLIKMYQFHTTSYTSNFLAKGGYISIIGHNSNGGSHASHDQISLFHGYEDLPNLSVNSSFSFSSTNSFDLTDETLIDYTMSIQTKNQYTITEASYTLEIRTSGSYVISLPENLNQTLLVNPGQNLTIDLPCKLDDFSDTIACDANDNAPPPWISLDCNNSDLQVLETNETTNIESSFSIKSTYQDGEILSTFSVTLVSCYYLNCESCNNDGCETCNAGYQWDNATSSCVEIDYSVDSKYGPIYNSTISTIVAQTVAGTSVLIEFSIALLTYTSFQDVWAITHFLRLILLLPLIALAMNNKVKEFIVSNAFVALSVYMLPLKVIKSIPLLKDVSFNQQDDYLRMLGWSSGSTLVNNFILLMILVLALILHLTLCLLSCLLRNREGWFKSTITKAYNFFTFTFYIRFTIEVYMFTILMLISEIKYYIKNDGGNDFGHEEKDEDSQIKGNYVSFSISCLMLLSLFVFMLFVFISWKRNKNNLKINEKCKTRELYNGIYEIHKDFEIKQQTDEKNEVQDPVKVSDSIEASECPQKIKIARLYYLLFLIKVTIIVLIVVLIPSTVSCFAFKVLSLLVVQTVYILYWIYIRSFTKNKHQVVEVLNDSVFFILLILLIQFYSKEKWNNLTTYIFIGVILSQLLILFIFSLVSAIIKFIKLFRQCKNKCTKSKTNETHIESESQKGKNESEKYKSINGNLDQDEPEALQTSNVYVSNEEIDQDSNEEDEKESQEQHNYVIL